MKKNGKRKVNEIKIKKPSKEEIEIDQGQTQLKPEIKEKTIDDTEDDYIKQIIVAVVIIVLTVTVYMISTKQVNIVLILSTVLMLVAALSVAIYLVLVSMINLIK